MVIYLDENTAMKLVELILSLGEGVENDGGNESNCKHIWKCYSEPPHYTAYTW
jgi:hypothetical protein